MLTEVAEGIHKLIIQFPGGMGEVNCYLLKGPNGYTVIDTGTDSEEAKERWKQILASGIIIEKVVLTHTHIDHIGLAKWFQQEVGVPVIVSNLGYEEMQKRRDTLRRNRINNLLVKHGGQALPDPKKDDSFIYDFEPDGFFENQQYIQLGEELFEAIWTPGHAPDHFCFYNRDKKIMIVGDHILQKINPVIGLWSGEEENPLQDYLMSLQTIKKYPTKIALSGHGGTIDHLQDRVNALTAQHQHRLHQVLQSVKNDSKTAYQICIEIYGTENIILNLSAFMATLTRLLYLESIGKVGRRESEQEVLFEANE